MNKKEMRDRLRLHNEEQNRKKMEWEKMHNQAISRRDFMAAGIIPFSAYAILPTWTQLLFSNKAQAADLVCGAAAVSNLCPFISIKLSGGMAMSANFVPMDKGRQLLPSYSKMGLGLGGSLRISYEFANNAPFYESSGLLDGIRNNNATPQALSRASFVGICVRSQDDSSGNKFDITGLVGKAGLKGKVLPNLGRANSETGVNNTYAYIKPSAPLVVGRYEDIANSLNVVMKLRNGNQELTNNQKLKLFESVRNLTANQARNIANYTGGDVLSNLLQCANQDNLKLIQNNGNLNTDPLANQAFAQIWGINNNTSKSDESFVFASMVYNALNGNASTVNLEMGGFDYHNGTRNGDVRDRAAGVVIGRVIQSMHLLQKKGFIVVTSDGSVSSMDSDIAGGAWASDRGSAGSAYMIGYDPAGAHETKSFQLGHFTEAQAADDAFLTGGSAELAAAAMFVNYLSFNGLINQVDNFLPRVFSNDQIDLVRVFA